MNNNTSVLNIGREQCISAFIVAVYLCIISNNPTNLPVLNGLACGGIVFNVNEEYGFFMMPYIKQVNNNADNALKSSILPE